MPSTYNPQTAEAMLMCRLLKIPAPPGLEQHQELEKTHRTLLRWAKGQGTGLPGTLWSDERVADVTELDDVTSIIVDRIIQHDLKAMHRTLVIMWYKTSHPREVIAKRIGLTSRASLYPEWRAVLYYLRGRFQGSGIDC